MPTSFATVQTDECPGRALPAVNDPKGAENSNVSQYYA